MAKEYNDQDIQRLDSDMQKIFSIMQNTHEMLVKHTETNTQAKPNHDWFDVLITNNLGILVAIAVAAVGFYNTTTNTLTKLDTDVSKLNKTIENHNKVLAEYKETKFTIELKYKTMEAEISKLQRAVNMMNTELTKDSSKQIEYTNKISTIEQNIFKLRREIKRLSKKVK